MFWLRLRRFLAEREVLVGVIIFGVLVMIADTLGDWNSHQLAAGVRIAGVILLLVYFGLDAWLRRQQLPMPVPLVFTEQTDRETARALFDRFVQSSGLAKEVRVIERLSSVRRDDLLIRLNRPNPRLSKNRKDWKAAWEELIREWEREVDKRLRSAFTDEVRCYHIAPHVVLPLSFALGASVNMRRSIVLYHQQQERFYKVLDLIDPRCLLEMPPPSSQPLERIENVVPNATKLILYLVISDRHPVDFKSHPDHPQATSVALSYKMTLSTESWLPYVQNLVQSALPWIGQHSHVEVCLICPSVIAFALGVAFSRTPKLAVCHWISNEYVPVFWLTEVERRLLFD